MSDAVSLTFPDGSVRQYPAGTTGRDVAESISKSLAKKAVAIALDGQLRDLSDTIDNGAIEIVTRDDKRALELIRHDAILFTGQGGNHRLVGGKTGDKQQRPRVA